MSSYTTTSSSGFEAEAPQGVDEFGDMWEWMPPIAFVSGQIAVEVDEDGTRYVPFLVRLPTGGGRGERPAQIEELHLAQEAARAVQRSVAEISGWALASSLPLISSPSPETVAPRAAANEPAARFRLARVSGSLSAAEKEAAT